MNFKSFLPYIVAVTVFIVVSLFYFHPVLEGKKIHQSDIIQFTGSSKEIVDFRNEYKAEPYWTNATFGGMPSYAVSTYYPHNYIQKLDKIIRFLPRPADYLFLYFIGFFILLLTLKVDWKLAIVGSLGFGLSTYLIIILGVGHNAKAHAIAYMPIVLAGVLMVFQKRYWLGFLVTALALAFEISANHVQMTYYLFFLILILSIVQLIESVKEKTVLEFAKKTGILIGAAILALGINATSLMATQEYAQNSTRSKGELTITADGSKREITNGLDPSYITEYSYGKIETFNLFISRFMGGTRHEVVENSALREFLQTSVDKGLQPDDANYLLQIASMYWGDQPIVAAPAYIGAVFIFLFVLALFLVKGKLKYWLVAATIFSILMSWGKNFAFLTDFFIDYVPLYNKFRAVSSIQVIAELTIPLLGILGLKALFSSETKKEQKLEALKWAVIIVGGLALIFTLFGSSLFAFETLIDIQIDAQISGFLDAIVADRQSLFFDDSLCSLILVAVTSGFLWLFLQDKIKKNIVVIGLGVLILFDLINVDKRYVNEDSFTTSRRVEKPFQMSAIDKEILKDESYYRIIDYTKNPMLDGGTSYFHKSLGGYHAAKPRRYQELYDFHIAKKNAQVLNMLNTKYIVDVNEQQQVSLQQNTEANGNAWFISTLKSVTSANQEIKALDSLDTKTTAIFNIIEFEVRFKSEGMPHYVTDSTAVVTLTDYKANQLKYESTNTNDGFAVFSEIYYKQGWNAYIDGKTTPIYRVNYVLRAIEIPKGTHIIEFKFEPKVIQQGSLITLISYMLLIGIVFGWYFYDKKKRV